MPMNRPTGRKRNITGQGKSVGRRGSGLGTGSVGSSRPGQSSGGGSFGGQSSSRRSSGGSTRSGGLGGGKLILILLALLLGGGGAGSFFLGGSDGGSVEPDYSYSEPAQQSSGGSLLSMLGTLGTTEAT